MNLTLKLKEVSQTACGRTRSAARWLWIATCPAGFAFWGLVTGCQTQPSDAGFQPPDQLMRQVSQAAQPAPTNQPNAVVLREGDVLKITFPDAPNSNLDTMQAIRRDGKITMPNVGEISAAGKTPADLERELSEKYKPLLLSSEVIVTVQSSFFPVYVTGMVLKPGEVMSDRPITALEAIMKAGGFDYTKANLKAVRVIRFEGGQFHNVALNLKDVMKGKKSEPYYLKPSDIVFVPERFTWF